MVRKKEATRPKQLSGPYEKYRGTPVWRVVEKAINDLVENEDLKETTRREYIVGYICKKLQRLMPKADV